MIDRENRFSLVEPESRPLDVDERQRAIVGIGGITVFEAASEVDMLTTVPEIDSEVQKAYIDRPEGPIVMGCSDDRPCTHESAAHFREQHLLAGENGYLRYFGGLAGLSRSILVAASVQYGPQTIERLNKGKFTDFVNIVQERAMAKTKVNAALHSDNASEGNGDHFDPTQESPVGCKYAASLLPVASLATENDSVHRQSVTEIKALFGISDDEAKARIDEIAASNGLFAQRFAETSPDKTGLGREDYAASKAQVMILEGDHAPTEETFAVVNFTADKISDPAKAQELGHQHYTVDITQAAEVAIKSFPELKLDPEILMQVMLVDAIATRTALASADGAADPARLEVRRYGDPREAISYLAGLSV